MPAKFANSPAVKLLSFIGITVIVLGGIAIFTADESAPNGQISNAPRTIKTVETKENAAADTVNEDIGRFAAQQGLFEDKVSSLERKLEQLINVGTANVTPTIDELELRKKLVDLENEIQDLKEGATSMTNVGDANGELGSFLINEEPPESFTFKTPKTDPVETVAIGKNVGRTGGETSSSELEWIMPVGYNNSENGSSNLFDDVTGQGEALFTNSTTSKNNSSDKNNPDGEKSETVINYATLDKEAILFDVLLTTDLIGIVPSNGTVNSPFPFKLELGKENFSTSNIHLPHLALMRMSGYAIGNWSLGCAQGIITSATFVFEDGVIHTVTVGEGQSGGGSSGGSSGEGGATNNQLGFIANEYGEQCIAGQKFSDLEEYAAISGGLEALGAVGQAISAQQFTQRSGENGNITQAFTGDTGQNALGAGLNGGLDAISNVVAARYAGATDFIVARANMKLVVHFSQQLEIDYKPETRRVINESFDEEVAAYYENQD